MNTIGRLLVGGKWMAGMLMLLLLVLLFVVVFLIVILDYD